MAKNKGGRPTKMTPELIGKLEDAFTWGCTDTEACCFADIACSTLYDYCEKNPQFSERKEKLKNMPVMKAKRIQMSELDQESVSQANKVIDRKEGQKIKLGGEDGGAILIDHTIEFIITDAN